VTSQLDAIGCQAEGAHQELPGFDKLIVLDNLDSSSSPARPRRVAVASVEGGCAQPRPMPRAKPKRTGLLRLWRRGGLPGCGRRRLRPPPAAASASATGRQHDAGGVNSRLNDTWEPACRCRQIPVTDAVTESKPIMELELESNSEPSMNQ